MSRPGPQPLLEITGLTTEINRDGRVIRAVDDVTLALAPGQCLGLVGESGCGKTMTARSILRLLPAGGAIVAGSIRLDGTELTALSERDMQTVRGNDIGMVFQDPSAGLDPTMTIGRQITESAVVHDGADRAAAAGRARELLRLVRMPDADRVIAQYPHQLSGGMRQRAMIAAALACRPRLLIADEPTTALDVTIQRDILDLIGDLRSELGMAVILVTHDLGVIAGRTERVAVMYGGRIIEESATAEVFSAPRHPYTEALFEALPELADRSARSLYSIPGRPVSLAERPAGCSFAPRCRYATDWCASHLPPLDGDHPGHTYACFFPLSAGPAVTRTGAGSAASPARRSLTGDVGQAPAVLRVSGLVKEYRPGQIRSRLAGGRQPAPVSAVADVSFELAAGQTFGLVGESGCGKTTLARLLAGLEHPDAGTIEFDGTELTALSARQRRREPGVQLMFQDSFASLDPRMRVRSILSEPLAIQRTVRRRGRRRQVARILDEVGLPPEAADRYPREFSGGQRQRLALARALIQRPAVIVADEPVSALDVSVQAQILNLMRKLQRQYGLSYLFISHDLSVIRYMADTIGVMYHGQVVETGAAPDVCGAPGHPYTAGLISAVPAVTVAARPALTVADPDGPGRGGIAEDEARAPDAGGPPPSGCRFRLRCPLAAPVCAAERPSLRPAGAAGQLVACHFPLVAAAADAG